MPAHSPRKITRRSCCAALAAAPAAGRPRVFAPLTVAHPAENEANPVTLPDGAIRILYMVRGSHVASIASTDNGLTWGAPRVEFEVPGPSAYACRSFLDREGELHVFFLRFRGEGRALAVDRMLDIWHARTRGGRSRWMAPHRIWEGYTGALRGVAQLRSGRILLPFAAWIPGRASAPPTGSNEVRTIYSDDAGATWKESPARLTAPCMEGYNGSNYGAVEPAILELADGRVWMLIRTQTGWLYESFSRDGVEWSPAAPSRFRSSNSPAGLLRLPAGRIAVFWNHCEPPPRVDGEGVYGGRDALHAAISSDEGRTWRGYREVYLDPTRHQTPPKRGDRATAYPNADVTRDGNIVLVTGQGEGRRVVLLFDPRWLLETERRDDFSGGLEGWSAFRSVGPASGWWRDRVAGASVSGRRLHVPHDGGAVWNFPHGTAGTVTLRLRPEPGAGTIALADRFFDPCDDAGERAALFRLPADRLAPGRWQTLELAFDTAARRCDVRLDGRKAPPLAQTAGSASGVNYLRLRSGLIVESVAAAIRRST